MKNVLTAFLGTLLLAACASLPKVKAPTATITTPAGASVTQTGDAQAPARLDTATESRRVPLPAGSAIVFDEKLGTTTISLSRDVVLTSEARTESAQAPQAFTPPKPPTASEQADARATLWYRLGLAAGLVAGIFGLVRGWDWIALGGGAIAGACAFALFIQRHPVLFTVMGIGAALMVAGPYIWHRVLKHLPNPDQQ